MREIKESYSLELMILLVVLAMLILPFVSIRCAHAAPTINLEIIKVLESSGNPHAYNKRSGATGLYQITKICLEDFNRFKVVTICRPPISTCKVDYALTMDDMYNSTKNRTVAHWYMNTRIPQLLKHYEIEDTLDHRLAAYNWGAKKLRNHLRGDIKMPRETRNYIRKYRRLQ